MGLDKASSHPCIYGSKEREGEQRRAEEMEFLPDTATDTDLGDACMSAAGMASTQLMSPSSMETGRIVFWGGFDGNFTSRELSVIGVCVEAVSASSCRTLFLLSDGNLYLLDENSMKLVDEGYAWSRCLGPPIAFPQPVVVKTISCAEEHSLALSSEGLLFSWGEGRYGRLGLGDETCRDYPILIESLAPLRCGSVATGRGHSIVTVVYPFETVYSFGRGKEGQLGLGEFENALSPHRISAFDGVYIVKCSASYDMSAILAEVEEIPIIHNSSVDSIIETGGHPSIKGDAIPKDFSITTRNVLYTFGSDSHGQLGCSDWGQKFIDEEVIANIENRSVLSDEPGINFPREVMHPMFETDNCIQWVNVTVGGYHCMAIDNMNNVYAWGYGGAFGHGDHGACLARPHLLRCPKPIANPRTGATNQGLACGISRSFIYTPSCCFVSGHNIPGKVAMKEELNGRQMEFEEVEILEESGGETISFVESSTNRSIIVTATTGCNK